MRSRSHERFEGKHHRHHHAPSRSHPHTDKHKRRHSNSSSSDKQHKKEATRTGLRIFIGTANLANKIPDSDSLSAFLPHQGKIHHVIHPSLKSSSIVDGVSNKYNNINTHGKLEIIAVGLQEATIGNNIVTTTGITAKLTGTTVNGRGGGFSNIMGSMGKPLDVMSNKISDAVGSAVKGVSGDVGGTKKLKDGIVEHLGEDYTLLTEYQRGEVVLYIFVRNDLAPRFKVCDLQGENVGFGSIMANKCGIAALISIGSTKLSFLSAHLAAHEGQVQARNDNMAEILAGTRSSDNRDPTLTAHACFVFGDLNYRCELPKQANGNELPKEEARLVCQKMVQSKCWSQLYETDELQKALEKKEVLVGFHTPKCKFPPTFKVEKRDGFHYNFKRTPSYTDRILWKSNEESRSVEPIIYEAVGNFTSSDHKPVRGLFFLPSRPTLQLDSSKSVFHVELSHIQCKGLKLDESLLQLDNNIDSFVRVKCEPCDLVISSVRNKFQTNTMKNTDRPYWRRDVFKFSLNVTSKDMLHGSFFYFESVQENLVSGDSVLGTCVFDLEHLIRQCLGLAKMSDTLHCELLRHGKSVGKLTCELNASWDSSNPTSTNCPSTSSTRKHSSNEHRSKSKPSHSASEELKHRRKSDSSQGYQKGDSHGSRSEHGHRPHSKSGSDAHSERRRSQP